MGELREIFIPDFPWQAWVAIAALFFGLIIHGLLDDEF